MNASNTDSVPVKPDSAQLLLVELNSMFPHDAWLNKRGEPDDDASMNFEELLGIPAKALHASTVHVSKAGDWSEDTFKTQGNLSNSCPLFGSAECLDATDADKGKKGARKCKRKTSGRARSKEKSSTNRRVCFSSEPPRDRNIPTPQPVAPDQGSGSGFTVISVGPPLRQKQIQSPQSSFSAFSPAVPSESSPKESPPKFSRRRRTKSLVVIPSENDEIKTSSLRQAGSPVKFSRQGRTNSLIVIPSKSDEISRTAHSTPSDAPPKFGRRGRTSSLIVLPTKRDEEISSTSHSTPMDSPPKFARRGRASSLVIVPTKRDEGSSGPTQSPVKASRRRRVSTSIVMTAKEGGESKATPPSTPTSSPVKFTRKRRTTSLTVQPTESGEFKAVAYPSPTERENVTTSLSPTQVRRKRSSKREKSQTRSQDRTRRSSKSSRDNDMDIPVLPGCGSVVDYDITRSPSGHLGPGPEISTPVGNSRKSVSSPGKPRSLSPTRSTTPTTALEMSMSKMKRAQLRSKILSPPLDSGSVVPASSDVSHRRSRVGNDNDALPTPSRTGPTNTPRGSRRKYVVSPHMPSPKNSSEYNAYLRSKSARYIARCGLLALPLETEDEPTEVTNTPTPRRAQSLASEYTRSTTSTATTAKTSTTHGSHSTSPGGVPDGHVGSSGTVRRRSDIPSAPFSPAVTPRSGRKAYLHTLDLVGQWKEEYRKNKPASPGGPPLTSDDFEEFQPKTPKRVDSNDSATQDDSLADAVETKEARLRQYMTKSSRNDRQQRDSYWVEAFKRNFFKRKSSHGRSNPIQPEVVF